MASLADIRAKLQALDSRRSGTFTGNSDNYPFWNIPNDSSARVRFLPDANANNTFFWVEKQMIKLEFPGIKGGDENKVAVVNVPCMEMWGESCPIMTETKPWWNDKSLEDLARKYWKKRTYIFQGLVLDNPISEDNAPENPIRKFVIGPQIFKIIKSSLLDPDFENIPTDYINGTDFTICKTQKGGYADYSTSKWSRKETALSEEDLAAIEEHGLKDLSDYLPKKPTEEQLVAIFEMFEASVEGELYDPAKWAKFYRPYGLEYQDDTATESAPAPKVSVEPAKQAPADDDGDIPFDTDVEIAEKAVTAPKEPETVSADSDASDSSGKSAQDILAMIRNRNKS
jgi:hypothetical protein